jgi:hypothetical protein
MSKFYGHLSETCRVKLRSRTVGLLERRDVELDRLQECVRDPLRSSGVLVAHHLAQHGGDDLPPETEPVDEPAAALCLAPSLEERVPVAVQLRLVVAQHDHRDGVVELMVRPRADGLEALSKQSEVDDLH